MRQKSKGRAKEEHCAEDTGDREQNRAEAENESMRLREGSTAHSAPGEAAIYPHNRACAA